MAVALVGPNPVIHLDMLPPGSHNITCHHLHHYQNRIRWCYERRLCPSSPRYHPLKEGNWYPEQRGCPPPPTASASPSSVPLRCKSCFLQHTVLTPRIDRGNLWSCPGGDSSGLESDPGTKLNCLFPVISEGLGGRDEALVRAALASPFLCPGIFECSQSQEKT